MTPALTIISKFGGALPLAKAIGVSVSTVKGWTRGRGLIPLWHAAAIMSAARARQLRVTAADFLPADAAGADAGQAGDGTETPPAAPAQAPREAA